MRAHLAGWRAWWTARGAIPRWKLIGAYALIVAAGFIGFLQIGSASDDATHAADQAKAAAAAANRNAASVRRLAIANRRLAEKIQRQRHALCLDQNAKHNHTIRKLDFLITKLPPAERAQAQRNRNANVQLINALAPRRNCAPIKPNP